MLQHSNAREATVRVGTVSNEPRHQLRANPAPTPGDCVRLRSDGAVPSLNSFSTMEGPTRYHRALR